jgi:hypothetical protein
MGDEIDKKMFTGVLHLCRKPASYALLLGGLILSAAFFIPPTAHATTGVNQQINFQGRLLNAQGATVPDGYYNVQFKIYQDGDGQTVGNTTGSPAGTLKWTESHLNSTNSGIVVKNGFMSVELGSVTPFGSSVDWNQNTLWLSMNIGSTSTTCTPFSACTPDGEMVPMKRLSATPYAINSSQLGGLTSAQFLQLAQGVQTDVANNTSSIYVNKTGTGNLLQFQGDGKDILTVAKSGDITLGNGGGTRFLTVAYAANETAGSGLYIAAGNAGYSTTASLDGGMLSLQGGAGTGAAGAGGNVVINGGSGGTAGNNGNVFIGLSNTKTVYVGNSSGSDNQNLYIGNVFGTGGGNITLGASGSASSGSTTLQAKSSITINTNGIARATFDNTNSVYFGNGVTASAPNNFTLSGTGSNTTGVGGGSLTLQGGSATVGNANGGSLLLAGGTGIGTGTSGSVIAKSNGSNSTNAFQVQNKDGGRVLGVDTTTNQVVLGQSNVVDGALVFKNSTSANAITLNSTAVNTGYTLTLPSAAPAGGLCLETSTGNASQLIFASCTNNNASIQQVRAWDANNTNSLTISPSTVGNEVVLTTQIPTSGVTVSSITGGGVSSWTKAVVSAGNGTVNRVEMWVGTVTATGNSTLTVNYSGSPGAEEITATEFTASGVNASTSWGIQSSASRLNSTSSTSVAFPNMTAINGSELYVGYAQVQNPPASSGSTPGFNYITTSTQHNVITYNTALAANTGYQPTATQNSSGQSNAVGVVLTAFVSSTSINNATSLQKANFYVQAASNGSVAGVLQAASTGTSDVFQVRDSSANNVLTVGYAGNVTLKPTVSSTALQVQNGSGNSVISVDTSANRVVLGSSNAMGGMLSFSSSGSSNMITLAAPASVAASYTLNLPTDTPTAGLCLATSPSNANQLIFASCATQVSAASISQVNKWSNNGTGVTTLADSPAGKGNLLVLYSHATNGVTVTGVSGGGVTNWTKVTGNSASATGQGNNEMWRGVVTAAGASTITVTYSGAAGSNEIVAQEFTMGSSSGTWAVDTSGTAINSGSQTTINYPSLTANSSSELYAGYAWSQNTMSAGSTAGFTYAATSGGKYLAYNTNVSNGTPTQPTATQSTAGTYNTIAAFIAAYAGTSVIVNSTATQQANFNVQAATSGTVAGVLQAANNSTTDIFQAKDGNGNNVATINSTSGMTLGSSNAIAGQINFNASGNSNVVSIIAPDAPGSSYTLKLPTTTPAAGQCLASSPNNASQLVFSSCANQVTSVAISYVNNWKSFGTGNALTLGVSPANLGDLMILFVAPQKANTVNTVSGGGVSAWSKITSTINGTGMEMWRGVVTSTGASTISVNLSGASGNNELAAMEYTTGSATGSWVVDTSNTQYNSSASTTVTYPNLTPQSTKDLYVGYAAGSSTMSAGSTTGFTYLTGSQTTTQGLYNTAVSAGIQPTATQSSSGTSVTAGALIAAYSSSSVISNSTVTQQANLNIQAATSNSVAGVFQSAAGGTQDIVDFLDSNGAIVGSFNNTGNLLIKPSTASSAALQVQTAGGTNVLSADTNGKLVVIGAGSVGASSPTLLVLDNETGTTVDPSAVNGAMYYNATTRSFRCGVADNWQNCNSLLYANTSTSSANNNCSNNCSAFTTTTAIPANYCQPGRVIQVFAAGYFSSQASPSNLQLGVYYGTDSNTAANDTLLGSLTPATSVTAANNNYFQMNFTITCFSTSTMQTGGTLGIQTGGSGAGLLTLPMGSANGSTVVTSSTKNLYIFPVWNVANTGNSATLSQLTVNAY